MANEPADLPPEAVEAAARAWLTETDQPDLLDTVDLAIAATALAAALPSIERAIREQVAQEITTHRNAIYEGDSQYFHGLAQGFWTAAAIARGASTDTEQR